MFSACQFYSRTVLLLPRPKEPFAILAEELRKSAKPQVVFVLGGPGSGKGTHCARVVKDFGFVHLSAGDLLREERSNPESKHGKLIDDCIKEGKMVPGEIPLALLRAAMTKHMAKGAHRTTEVHTCVCESCFLAHLPKSVSTFPTVGDNSVSEYLLHNLEVYFFRVRLGKNYFLIDGFPRSEDNNNGWVATMSDFAVLRFVLYMDCPLDVMEKRLLKRGETSGRADDNAESIRKRFKTFQEESVPVVNKYRELGLVREVVSDDTQEVVYNRVWSAFADEFPDSFLGEQTTFAFIKPDAFPRRDEILARIAQAGFDIVAKKEVNISDELADQFYAEHVGKSFYPELKSFMLSGPAVALALKRVNAIKAWRTLMGPTKAEVARETAPDCLRALFGTDTTHNATHGSDSVISADRELRLLFPEMFVAEAVAKENTAFVFVKPHAMTEATKQLVHDTLLSKGLKIINEGQIMSEDIDKKKLIDQHYYAIASKATILKPHQLNIPADKFKEKFGEEWQGTKHAILFASHRPKLEGDAIVM